MSIKSAGGIKHQATVSKRVLYTHADDKSKQPSRDVNHWRRAEQVPGKYLNPPAALRPHGRPPRQQVEAASRSGEVSKP